MFLLTAGLIVSFQNCGGKTGPNGLCIGGCDPGGPSLGTLSVDYSNVPSYATNPAVFNYSDTIYQRAINFNSTAQGCIEIVGQSDGFCNVPANMVALSSPSAGWTFNSGSNIWSTSMPVNFMHGRTYKAVHKRTQDGQSVVKIFSVQSIAAATTNDVMHFYSTDPGGLNVIGDVSNTQSTPIYSHIKNGTTSDYICQYVISKQDGTSNGPDNCATTVPPDSNWKPIPAETYADGNNTMLTYSLVPNTIHVTKVKSYVFKGGTKYGPWLFDFHQ